MKLCIFSDIHGNGAAFEAAYPLILRESADLNIFLGDLCGYYFEELAIWEKLRVMPRLVALKGNHDEMFLRAFRGDEVARTAYRQRYGSSLENFLTKDIESMIAWMGKLASEFSDTETRLLCCHGSPRDSLKEYVYPTTSLEPYSEGDFDICVMGHTHHVMARANGKSSFVNAGSIGQPRDGKLPVYVIITTETRKIEFKHFYYDTSIVLRSINAMGGNPAYLTEVILRMEPHG